MSNYSKADINSRYDKLRAQLKAGSISQSNFKAAADRLYKLYHSKQNKAARTQTAKPQSKVQKAVKAVKAAKTSKQQGDGSVKATRRMTSYDKAVQRKNKEAQGYSYRTGPEDREFSRKNEIQLNKPKKPKLGDKYKNPSTNQIFYWDGSKWVKGRLGKSTRLKTSK